MPIADSETLVNSRRWIASGRRYAQRHSPTPAPCIRTSI
jgi:hypothetical protein